MLRMQTTTENGKVHGKVTTIQSMGTLGPLSINGVTVVNTRHIAPLNIPGIVSMEEGLLEELAEGHYKITPFRGEKVTAKIFNKDYYTGPWIEVNGEVVIVDGVQMTNESKVKPAAEPPKTKQLLSGIIQPPANHNETKKAEPTLTALHKAAANNDTISITNLINQGEEVNIENHRKWTPLHFAAARGHLEAVELLLQKGANAEKITGDHNGNGCTPAELAASSAEGKDPILKLKFLKIKDILELHIQNSKKMITNGR